jgi:hypothetical protein
LTNFHVKKAFSIIGLLLIAFFILPSIVPAEDKITDDMKGRPVKMAIIPFQALTPIQGSGNTVICPLCGAGYSAGKIEKGAERILEEIFIEKIKIFKNIEILPQEKVDAVYKRISAESFKSPLMDILKKVGAELKTDFLAVGFIFRYTERIGSDFGVDKPASVAFEVNFISSPKGDIIWQGVFDKTQKSLSEDVFHVSSLKWLTARELATHGMKEILGTFSGF